MNKISAVIITYNEEEYIARCLASLKNYVDEIVVVDSLSTDKTKDICLSYGVTFIEQPFLGYRDQKNFAIQQAKYPYLISLDGDEAIDETLQQFLLTLKQEWKYDAYSVRRRTNYCGQWIRFSDRSSGYKTRLFKKDAGSWQGLNIHEKYIPHKNKTIGRAKGAMLHWVYNSYSEHNQKIEHYTNISAQSYFEKNKKATIFKIIIRPLWSFLNVYIVKGGFLDGLNGYVMAVQSFNVTFLKYIKLYELQKRKKNNAKSN